MSFNPDRINIHELTIEEPEKQTELPFDVERDVSKEDWERMWQSLENSRKYDNQIDFSTTAMCFKILDPKVDLNLNEADLDGMRSNLEMFRNKIPSDWQNFYKQAAELKIIDPKIDIKLDKARWDGEMPRDAIAKSLLESSEHNINWHGFATCSMRIKIIDPGMDLNLDESIWNEMHQELEGYRSHNNWKGFARQATEMKILDPKIELNLDRGAWEGMHQKLEMCRSFKFVRDFMQQVKNMKILAAEKLEVTENGLELTMSKKRVCSLYSLT